MIIENKIGGEDDEQITTIEAKLAKAKAANNELQSKLVVAENEKVDAVNVVTTQLQAELDDMIVVKKKIENDLLAVTNKKTDNEFYLNEVKKTKIELENKLIKLEKAISAIEVELLTANSDKDKLQNELNEIEKTKATLEKELAAVIAVKNEKSKVSELANIIASEARNLGKLYIGETMTPSNDNKKVEAAITAILKNKYGLNLEKIEIKIDDSKNQVLIKTIDEGVYLGSVTLTYELDTSFVTLDYLVPDIATRYQKVATYPYQHHQEIKNAKNDILQNDEFKNLPKAETFINELNEKVKYQASIESLNAFKKIETNNDNFKDFTDLKTQFNDYNHQFQGEINFDDFIKTIIDYYENYNITHPYQIINIDQKITELKTAMVRFYNILAQVYGKKNVLRMLKEIEFKKQISAQNKAVVGTAFWGVCNDNMCQSLMQLNAAVFTNIDNGMGVMVHEYGHVLDYLVNIDTRKYMISSLAADTKITNEAYQKLLAYGIVRSSYGRVSYNELSAEAFGRWILTPPQNRDLGWEKLDKYFRIDLVKKLSSGQ